MTTTLNLVGAAFISYDLADRALQGDHPVIAVLAWAAVVVWVTATLVPERLVRLRTALYLVMIVAGSFVACATNVVGFVPAIAGLLIYIGSLGRRWRAVVLVVAASAALVSVGALVAGSSVSTLISVLSGLLAVALGGLSRRQFHAAEAQTRALLEERLAVEQERALVSALTERSRIARDLHDVLAHSLGGLVIQLDAVDALLESGRDAEARQRVISARELAVDGLAEAKRAVTALHEPPSDVESALAEMAATHRQLGGAVVVQQTGQPQPLGSDARVTFRRALQELLTNARRHASGSPVMLTLTWQPSLLELIVSTAASARTPNSIAVGGGHGLVGMRERVEAVGGSMSVRPGDPFMVVLTLPTGGKDAQ
ncbi:sensor histidine kinase [Cryptosporangium sp. NPDC048952]|uniref:sensor histidine kinase n=1 Tax=Cryptosporangium sp. NPDC048952 TaxID=3363961 RepID=UPI003710FEF7